MAKTHGLSHTGAYKSWAKAKRRCYNPNEAHYSYHGGRGIRMCERWRTSFPAFFADMRDRPPDRSLDRVDNDGDYTPENCRWATKSEQVRNRTFRRSSYQRTYLDWVGKVFARWTVIAAAPRKTNNIYWVCRCTCGKEKIVCGYTLQHGQSRSCGCLRREVLSQLKRKHV